MRIFTTVCCCLAIAAGGVQAKNTSSVFSLGMAIPMSSAAPTHYVSDPAVPAILVADDTKKLGMGWEGAWTFFGFPFADWGTTLSGLAFGGKISYSRWERDSTMKECTFLGTQVIARYNFPLESFKPFNLFVQGGAGMFIGEHGFADPDTMPVYPLPDATEMVVFEGKKNLGASLNVGINWDIIEVSPGLTFVLTGGKPSSWFSLNAAMKF